MAISFLQTMATFNFSVNESGTRRLLAILLNQAMSLSVSKSWPSILQDQIFDGRNIRTFGNACIEEGDLMGDQTSLFDVDVTGSFDLTFDWTCKRRR
jgi:hypothetical protein